MNHKAYVYHRSLNKSIIINEIKLIKNHSKILKLLQDEKF